MKDLRLARKKIMKNCKRRFIGVLLSLPTFLLTITPVLARTTVTATTTSGGNWTATGTWTCSPALSPCIPNNTASDVFDVGINGEVHLNSSSSPTSVTIDSLTLVGDLYVEDGGALNLTTAIANSGFLEVVDGGKLATNPGVNLTNNDIIHIENFNANTSTVFSIGGNLTNTSSFRVESFNAATTMASVGGNLANSDTVQIGEGPATSFPSTLKVGGTYSQSAGKTGVDGTLIAPVVNISGGSLFGGGTIQGDVTIGHNSTLTPGDEPATTLHMTGPLNMMGTLDEAINSASVFAATDITGTLTLGSSSVLDIILTPGFTPAPGTSFTIMDFGSLDGTFGSITNDMFNNGKDYWSIEYNPKDIVLTAQPKSTQPVPVPEPGSLLLLGAGFLGIACIRRRRQPRISCDSSTV